MAIAACDHESGVSSGARAAMSCAIATLAIMVCEMAASSAFAAAETYPSKVVRIVVPFPPSGSTDLLARVVAQLLNEAWRQSVIVENRGIGGGIPGSEYVAKLRGDGYTLLLGTPTTHAVAATLYSNLPYDIQRDFVPVTELVFTPQLLSVHPSLPVKSVKELVSLAKARPGELNYGAGGVAGTLRMSMELFQMATKVKMLPVQYRGSGPAMIGLLGGEVQLMFDVVMTTLPQMYAGRVRTIAVTTLERSPIVPQIPTIAESGYPGFETSVWFGLFAPAGTPADVVKKIYESVATGFKAQKVRESLAREALEIVASSPADFNQRVASEIVKWRKVIQTAGIKATF